MSKNFTFNNAPAIQMARSRISGLSYGVNSSMSLGRLYPFYSEEVLPGDTFKVDSNVVVRLTSSFIKPIYGNLFADVFYFFVPWRLVYDDFSCIFGENKHGYWSNTEVFTAPTLSNQTVSSKSLADYLEFPVGTINTEASVLYHRAVALIWNEWFRDENYQEPVHIQKGLANLLGEAFNDREWSPDNYTGLCPPISKYKDYFTSVLPSPQKGDPVKLVFGDYAPLVTRPEFYDVSGNTPLGFQTTSGSTIDPYADHLLSIRTSGSNTNKGSLYALTPEPEVGLSTGLTVVPGNLYADLTTSSPMTVNDLRLAFQMQKILERDALGTRYVEHIQNTFGVSNPDSRVQRPEMLNGGRFSINVQQVASTQSGEAQLAQLGAYSLSNGKCGFSKAFTEYGCIIGFLAIRQFHSYSQGMPKRYTRKNRLDFYNPALAYIGMMPVMSTELYAQSPASDVFGYQRAWSEYRHHQNAITGEMRSQATNSLDVWHIGDEYASQPVAGAEFITETPNNLNRVITVDSTAQDQFIIDAWHNVEAIRVMPANPMPGLIDHY